MPKTSKPAVYDALVTYKLFALTCYLCGVLFGIEGGYDERRRKDHKSFFCPNGHSQAYVGPSQAERERDAAVAERDAARALAERESRRRRNAEITAEHERRSAAAHKGWATRIRNRIKNGVCPCCNRSFANVRRHIETKHPDFSVPEMDA